MNEPWQEPPVIEALYQGALEPGAGHQQSGWLPGFASRHPGHAHAPHCHHPRHPDHRWPRPVLGDTPQAAAGHRQGSDAGPGRSHPGQHPGRHRRSLPAHPLSTIIGGRIEYLGVKEGDQVKKGQLLLKLWNDDQQAQAALAQAQIELSRKRVDEACIAAANAENEAQRQGELRARGFVSTSREEAARTEAEVRRAACNTAIPDVAQAEARFKATRVEQGRGRAVRPVRRHRRQDRRRTGRILDALAPGVPTRQPST